MTVYGALMAVYGDTPAQHEVAGFKEGVGFAYSGFSSSLRSVTLVQGEEILQDSWRVRLTAILQQKNPDECRSNLKSAAV
ncbi:hypothetical protein NQZ68_031477 [Dissostichus eleginoides]|nr:hypothetical protein NQZ68_031477 [Dissostichus eleginoides]